MSAAQVSALPVLTWSVGFLFVCAGLGVLAAGCAVAARIRHGKSPKWQALLKQRKESARCATGLTVWR